MPAFLFSFFSFLAKFLLSGLIARIAVSVLLNVLFLGALFLFYKNFAGRSLDYALSFFSFVGWGELVDGLRYHWSQLPSSFREVVSFFDLGGAFALMVNNFISSVFLAWIMRRFG